MSSILFRGMHSLCWWFRSTNSATNRRPVLQSRWSISRRTATGGGRRLAGFWLQVASSASEPGNFFPQPPLPPNCLLPTHLGGYLFIYHLFAAREPSTAI